MIDQMWMAKPELEWRLKAWNEIYVFPASHAWLLDGMTQRSSCCLHCRQHTKDRESAYPVIGLSPCMEATINDHLKGRNSTDSHYGL